MRCDQNRQGLPSMRPNGTKGMQDSPSPRVARNRSDDIAVPKASPASFPILTSDLPGGPRQHDPNLHYSYPRKSMDPLTLTTSVITIITAAVAITKAVDNLSTTLKDARSDLCSLSNEISDLRVVLDGVDAVLKEWQSGRVPVPMNDMGLSHILTRLEQDLKDLNNMVLSCLINPNSTSQIKPNRIKWFLEKKNIKNCQAEIRERKQDLTAVLTACTMSGVAKLQVSIHHISLGIDNIHTEQKNAARARVTPLLEAPPTPSSNVDDEEFLDTTEYIEPPTTRTQDFPETPGEMFSVLQHAENIKIEASFLKKNKCRVLCGCRCHQKGSIRTSEFTKKFIGSLFVGYSCLPFVAAKCNEKRCRQRETKVVIAYQFPKWFWAQQLFKASVTAGAPSGPEFLLRVQRVFPWSSEIYQYCLDGNVSGLKRMFEDRIISPYDVDPQGRSLIHNALRGKNTLQACELFLAAGADLKQEDQFGHSALHAVWDQVFLASPKHNKNRKLIEFIKGDGGLDNRNFTRLHKIVLGILLSPLKAELENSTAEIDIGDSVGRTPLFWASSRGDVETVSMLLEYGADPNIVCPSGGPLTMAAKNGHAEVTTMLIEAGADVEGRCSQFRTPLIEASTSIDNNKCIDILLDHGANINAQDCHLESPVLEAAMNGKLANLKVLLARGADMDLVEHDGWSPLASCIFWMERDTAPCIRELINAGADYTLTLKWGDTVLHNAAQYAGIPSLKVMTEGKLTRLDPEARTTAGMTARDLAECRTDVDEEWWEWFEKLMASVVAEPEPEAEAQPPVTSSTSINTSTATPVDKVKEVGTTITVSEVGPESRNNSISEEGKGEVEYVENVSTLKVQVFYDKPVNVKEIALAFGGKKPEVESDDEEVFEDAFEHINLNDSNKGVAISS